MCKHHPLNLFLKLFFYSLKETLFEVEIKFLGYKTLKNPKWAHGAKSIYFKEFLDSGKSADWN